MREKAKRKEKRYWPCDLQNYIGESYIHVKVAINNKNVYISKIKDGRKNPLA